MAQLIIESKKGKDGQIEYIVSYHDKKSDNSFTITTTTDLDETVEKLKTTFEGEVQAMLQKNKSSSIFKSKMDPAGFEPAAFTLRT